MERISSGEGWDGIGLEVTRTETFSSKFFLGLRFLGWDVFNAVLNESLQCQSNLRVVARFFQSH